MGFNEGVHAYIIARYYVRMQEAFGTRAEPAFIHAVQYYAGQRGRRMAQRAIRDGKPLTHATFLQYGELKMTDGAGPTQRTLVSRAPDYELHITACPWHAQFARMGCQEAGAAYCRYIDEALCRGFSPDIPFEALCSLNTADRCIHRVAGQTPRGLRTCRLWRDTSGDFPITAATSTGRSAKCWAPYSPLRARRSLPAC